MILYILGARKLATTFYSSKDDKVKSYIENIPLEHRKKKEKKSCSYCSYSTLCICRLEKHVRKEHGKCPTLTSICPLCGKLYKNSCDKLKHIKRDHPKNSAMAKIALEERSHILVNYNIEEVIYKCTNCYICTKCTILL